MTAPVHFASRIEISSAWVYTAACGVTGTDPKQFSNERGIVLKSLGGVVTCEACREKMGVVRCDGGGQA